MTSHATPHFELTADHLENGLTEKDFSHYAGFHVPTITLSSFPHWEILRDQCALTAQQHRERAIAIYRELLPKRALKELGGRFDGKDTESLALLRSCAAHVHADIADIEGGEFHRFGIDGPVRVFGKGKVNAAIILHNDYNESVRHLWAAKLGLSVDAITKFPVSRHIHLVDSLHEMAHIKQEEYRGENVIPTYCKEAEADYFAHHIAYSGGVDKTVVTADIQARYFSMLKDPPQYWFADTLASLYREEKPLDFFSTFDAVKELRTRLALFMLDDPDKDMPIDTLHIALLEQDGRPSGEPVSGKNLRKVFQASEAFDTMINYWLKETPRELFSIVNRLAQNDGCLSGLAHRFARQIVIAAESFNPDLTLTTPCRDDCRKRKDVSLERVP